MAIPGRRYFRTASTHETDDILRSTDDLLDKIIDSNDVIGADVGKTLLLEQTILKTKVAAVEQTLLTSGTGNLGTIEDFNTAFNTAFNLANT